MSNDNPEPEWHKMVTLKADEEQSQSDVPVKDWTLRQYIWCALFHRRYRKRTGTRRILRASIVYDVRCEKCGVEDTKHQWVIPELR